jgi:hypothetical protein
MISHTVLLTTVLLTTVFLSACDPVDVGPDAYVPAALEVGNGHVAFVSFEDGDTLELVRGVQGLQHVWVAIRLWGIEPRGTILSLSLVRDRDEAVVSQPLHVRVSLTPVEGEPYSEVTGLTLVVPVPEEALDEALTLRASVTEAGEGGEVVALERPVRVAWSPGGY